MCFETRTFALGKEILYFLFMSFAYVINGDICYTCNMTNDLSSCMTTTNCPNDYGCYSQTWLVDANRMYKKGCSDQFRPPCGTPKIPFCTLDLAAVCCLGDKCNAPDPVKVWRPEPPQSLILSNVDRTSATLVWDSPCIIGYEYRIEYGLLGEDVTTLSETLITSVTIPGLRPGNYQFSVRSSFDKLLSDEVVIRRTVPSESESPYTFCSTTLNSTLVDTSTTVLLPCLTDQQMCFSTLEYGTDGEQPFVSRGCATHEDCAFSKELSRLCNPGVANSYCPFCCQGNNCNGNNTDIFSNLTCDGINFENRIDCGWEGISAQTCESRGCCFSESPSESYNKWCYHKRNTYQQTQRSNGTTGLIIGGLAYWAFIGVVLGVIVLFFILFLIGYFVLKKRKEKKVDEADLPYQTHLKARERSLSTISGSTVGNSMVMLQEKT